MKLGWGDLLGPKLRRGEAESCQWLLVTKDSSGRTKLTHRKKLRDREESQKSLPKGQLHPSTFCTVVIRRDTSAAVPQLVQGVVRILTTTKAPIYYGLIVSSKYSRAEVLNPVLQM